MANLGTLDAVVMSTVSVCEYSVLVLQATITADRRSLCREPATPRDGACRAHGVTKASGHRVCARTGDNQQLVYNANISEYYSSLLTLSPSILTSEEKY